MAIKPGLQNGRHLQPGQLAANGQAGQNIGSRRQAQVPNQAAPASRPLDRFLSAIGLGKHAMPAANAQFVNASTKPTQLDQLGRRQTPNALSDSARLNYLGALLDGTAHKA